MPIPSDLVTVAEAAKMLGVKPTTIRYAIMRGTLRAIPIDARTNGISREDVERYRTEHLRRRGPKAKSDETPADEPAKENDT